MPGCEYVIILSRVPFFASFFAFLACSFQYDSRIGQRSLAVCPRGSVVCG